MKVATLDLAQFIKDFKYLLSGIWLKLNVKKEFFVLFLEAKD